MKVILQNSSTVFKKYVPAPVIDYGNTLFTQTSKDADGNTNSNFTSCIKKVKDNGVIAIKVTIEVNGDGTPYYFRAYDEENNVISKYSLNGTVGNSAPIPLVFILDSNVVSYSVMTRTSRLANASIIEYRKFDSEIAYGSSLFVSPKTALGESDVTLRTSFMRPIIGSTSVKIKTKCYSANLAYVEFDSSKQPIEETKRMGIGGDAVRDWNITFNANAKYYSVTTNNEFVSSNTITEVFP